MGGINGRGGWVDVSSLRKCRQSPRASTEGRPDTRSRKWFAGPDGTACRGGRPWPAQATRPASRQVRTLNSETLFRGRRNNSHKRSDTEGTCESCSSVPELGEAGPSHATLKKQVDSNGCPGGYWFHCAEVRLLVYPLASPFIQTNFREIRRSRDSLG